VFFIVMLALVVAAPWTASVAAHEAGVARAVITFPSADQYVIDLTVDAASLLTRLELLSRHPRSALLSAPEYADRISSLQSELMKHVRIRIDSSNADAVFESVREADGPEVSPLLAPQVRIRMHGNIPRAAKSMTWCYDLSYASYALTVKPRGADEASAEWLEGGQESRPFPLSRPLGTLRRVLTKGLDCLPFALMFLGGLFPFSRRPVSPS
jgi:hypothetical protein